MSPPDALEDMEPDEEHFHEATGNEGASFERTYHRAALVLWPRSRRLSRTTDNLRELASAVSIVADLTTSLAYQTIAQEIPSRSSSASEPASRHSSRRPFSPSRLPASSTPSV